MRCDQFIAVHTAQHRVALSGRVLGVSRSGSSAWRERLPSARSQSDARRHGALGHWAAVRTFDRMDVVTRILRMPEAITEWDRCFTEKGVPLALLPKRQINLRSKNRSFEQLTDAYTSAQIIE